ncbi:winged helix-turn-helix domain-containing protein [Pseudoalteromonas luteoviolacea]|uniref:OmpR/PhoB-type domain-containing protein n=1 Tax=Pseudoalteromonas luteoviolacea H33 TaxID=1365251 RepID=A0A167DQL0_9GAMM|nr:winged helix-turn-helix domain-containing protein [Pseudoalteromonas luteoviolacea]KZN49204.1 hypothetical protein N476_20415 [Pseudoalteromonas luteoviolacea H33]KZN73634.1 hypothetical protein N477_23315 [Pseudoalteromonas luteoviolacea H33-S]MBQ4875643.1 winged helix-turn-helix domain-containing protein [Pseudoalteromonas luteoviolacea]MBQ4904678.1 winged helix-turn-helix domain-containing protein [Pseudoalteromonas luteoviolacea]
MQFERFLLNDVLIDTQKMSVKVDGIWRPLEHKQLALIRLLIEKSPEPVSRDEIINQLWPNLVVSDNSVSQLVAQIRKTLNDTSKEPTFIKTVPRLGYQCIAIVANAPTLAQRANSPQKNIPIHWLVLGAFLGFIITFIALFDFNIFKSTPKIKYISRITSSPGAEAYLSFSPNGRFLAYSQIVAGQSQYDLVVHDLQTNSSHTIKSSGYSEQAPNWSEDGKWLLYYRYSPFSCEVRGLSVHNAIELWRLNRDVSLLECDSAQVPQKVILNKSGQLFVNEMSQGEKGIVKYNIYMDDINNLSLSKKEIVAQAEAYRSRGDQIIYKQDLQWVQGTIGKDGEIRKTGLVEVGDEPYFGLTDGSWLSAGSELKLHSPGQQSSTLYKPYGEISEIAINSETGLIAHTEGSAEVNLYEFSITSDTFTAVSSNSRIDTQATISSDGMQVAYVSTTPHADPQITHVEVWLKHRFKSSPNLLTSLLKKDKPKLLLFSPNGEYLAMLSESNTLFIINTFSKIPRSVIKENQTLQNIYWSNDGKSLYFKTIEEKRSQFWKHEIASASNTLLPELEQPYTALINKNESFDSYINDIGVYLYEALQGEVPLHHLSYSLELYRPAIYKGGIYYVVRQGHQLSLFNYNIKEQTNEFISDVGLYLYDVNVELGLSATSDGEYIIINRIENLEMDIVLHEFLTD